MATAGPAAAGTACRVMTSTAPEFFKPLLNINMQATVVQQEHRGGNKRDDENEDLRGGHGLYY